MTPTSSATRLATDMAATRRGCVQPILPRLVYPASARYCVICVVLPDPVSPITTRTCRVQCRCTCATNEQLPPQPGLAGQIWDFAL